MWRTPAGNRVLKGAEWALFRAGIGSLWDEIEMCPDPIETGVAVFDSLTMAQQLAMLALVGEALSDRKVPKPELTAITEGTVGAVFEQLRRDVEFEIDSPVDPEDEDPTHLRRMVVAAYSEVRAAEKEAEERAFKRSRSKKTGSQAKGSSPATPPPAEKMPSAKSKKMTLWDSVFETLKDQVLWDEDYDLEDSLPDLEPGRAAALRSSLRVPDDYFVGIAPDPDGKQLEEVCERLRRLTGRPDPGR